MSLTFLEFFTKAEWISIFSAIVTFTTALIALLTVREIKKQREHSYHPDINISNFDFYVYKYDDELNILDLEEEKNYYLFYSKDRLQEDYPITGYNELKIGFNNIGFGVAKDIKYEWGFDFDIALKLLQNSDKQLNFSFENDDDDLNIVYPPLNIDWFYTLYEENIGDDINFILPYSIENRIIEATIPKYFLDLYWLFMAKGIMPDSIKINSDFPPLNLKIEYTNIHGKQISKKFTLLLQFLFISNPLNAKRELGKFKFQISEV